MTIEAGVTLLFKPGRGIRIRGLCGGFFFLIMIAHVIHSRNHLSVNLAWTNRNVIYLAMNRKRHSGKVSSMDHIERGKVYFKLMIKTQPP